MNVKEILKDHLLHFETSGSFGWLYSAGWPPYVQGNPTPNFIR